MVISPFIIACNQLTLISIWRGLASSDFGSVILRIPLLYSAATLSGLIWVGSSMVRVNLPAERSLR